MERLNREKKIDCDIIKAKIGTTNAENPIPIYLEFSGFLSPIYEKDSYKDDIKIVKKYYDKLIREFINNTYIFSDKHITVFSVSESCIQKDKRSFYSIQTVLKQNTEQPLAFKAVYNKVYPNVENIINGIKEIFDSVDFAIVKSKNS